MGLLGTIFGEKLENPPIALRDTLFGDLPIDQWTGNGSASRTFPWSAFVSARARIRRGEREPAVQAWWEVINHPSLPPRHYLQAWHFLRQNGCQPPSGISRQVLGVVVEIGMPEGLDLLAVYPNHTARYYNYSGQGVVWERPNTSLDKKIDALLEAAAPVVAQVGTWNQARPPAPPRDQVRLNFLTPGGLHFGQAHLDVMAKDSLGGPVLARATVLMQALIDRARTGSPN